MKKNGDEKEKESSEVVNLLQQLVDGQMNMGMSMARIENNLSDFKKETREGIRGVRQDVQKMIGRFEKNFAKLIEATEERNQARFEEIEKRLEKVEAKGR